MPLWRCQWLYQSTKAATHSHASPLSFESLGLEKDLSTPIFSNRDSSVAPHNRVAEAFGYGIAVIGMEDQRRLVALVAAKAAGPAVALLETGSLHQISRDVSRLQLGHIPGHQLVPPARWPTAR